MTGRIRRVFAPGLTLVAVLTGALTAVPAQAADGPVFTSPQTMQDLVKMPAADLAALYAVSPAASVPSGFTPGRAIKKPGSRFTAANARATQLVWQGKIFRDDGTMINRFGLVKAIPADVYVGESWVDGQPALIFDYKNSKLWPDVRDEVREVSPGLYLGIMYKGKVPEQKMFFALDARK